MVKPTVLSLFSGAGGLDLGLEAAGFDLVAAVEKDAHARQTLTRNRPQWTLARENDVFDFAQALRPASIGLRCRELDLLAGGPPCQPFSMAAQWQEDGRRGTNDPRATCIDALVDVAEILKPRVILVENVPGFVRRERSGLSQLVRRLELMRRRTSVRYDVHSTVLDAERYGVPQLRKRSFVVAIRDDVSGTFEWPIPSTPDDPLRAGDAIANLAVDEEPVTSGRWADLLPTVPAGENYMFHTPNGRGEPLFGARTRFWSFLLKLHPSRPAWTLPASPGPSTGPFHWNNRPLAVEEMARLQTFPHSWAFSGSRHLAVRQVGNAAPPLLVEHVGRSIAGLLGKDVPATLTHRIARKPNLPRAPRVRDVPPEFLSRRGDHSPHAGTGKGPRPRTEAVG
jgi:DNA (cytosine-5)-methyltransferase 1